jgi:hypothetical protein
MGSSAGAGGWSVVAGAAVAGRASVESREVYQSFDGGVRVPVRIVLSLYVTVTVVLVKTALQPHGTLARQISRAHQKIQKATALFGRKNVQIAFGTTKISLQLPSCFIK